MKETWTIALWVAVWGLLGVATDNMSLWFYLGGLIGLVGWGLLELIVPWLRRRHPGDQWARELALDERLWWFGRRIGKLERDSGLPCVYPTPCDCPGCVRLGRDVPMVQKGAR